MTDASMHACVIHAFVRGTPGRRGDGGEVTMRTMTMRTTRWTRILTRSQKTMIRISRREVPAMF